MVGTTTKTLTHPELYTPIHKGIRGWLFQISIKAGKMDYSDDKIINDFHSDLADIISFIRMHHTMEEKFFHPLISERVPGGADRLEYEHREVEIMIAHLAAHYEVLIAKTGSFEKQRQLSLEFYLAFNRLIAFFLKHIDYEEEEIERELWDLCTMDELMTAYGKMLAGQSREELTQSLEIILPVTNLDELTGIFLGAKRGMPPEVFKMASDMAQQRLDNDTWNILKTRAGIS
jgi:hypothetical protein